ncbi:trimeric intracellular cation channel family protein [Nocardia panacis]|uniref:Trimeric intracellular cation channel family protein n=1 Tax=Nocardia panacis TaxID=2340916 RepID=A0A3A4KNE6_9NOCA|nr:trimeric intracellular cation channel family protein [Nocardia panacis]RJO78783.1 trimeric intracellular cation channel family protein [Nocardia panacis]
MAAVQILATQLDSAVNVAQRAGELFGVLSFATSGALLAVRKNLDIFGMAVLACATALGGGVIRDLLIGRTPPAAFTDLTFLCVSLAATLIVFLRHPPARLVRGPLEVFDAIGLGLFCVTGTVVAYHWGTGAATAALLGMVTGIGGGVIRDLLAGLTPSVLRPDQELYAVPALIGSAVTAVLLHYGLYQAWTGALAAASAIVLRLLARRFGWRAPQALRHIKN